MGIPLIPLLVEDLIFGSGQFAPQLWGIFDQGGNPIITSDSVAAVQFTRDYQISTYPQEQGAFTSYNKVQVPFQTQVSFLISSTRYEFLNAIEFAAGSLQLVSVYTPEIAYPSANIIHYNYRREQRSGVELIRVDVWVEEVRVWGQNQTQGPTQGNNSQGSNSAIVGGNVPQGASPGGFPSASPTTSIGQPATSGAPTTQSNNGIAPQNQGEQVPVAGNQPALPNGTEAPFVSPLPTIPF